MYGLVVLHEYFSQFTNRLPTCAFQCNTTELFKEAGLDRSSSVVATFQTRFSLSLRGHDKKFADIQYLNCATSFVVLLKQESSFLNALAMEYWPDFKQQFADDLVILIIG